MQELDPGWVGIAGVISAIGTFFVGQRQGKAEFITAVTKASDIVISRLQKEIARVDDARAHCEDGHQECRDKVVRLENQVAMLMRGDIPQYRPSDLRRQGD